MLGNLDKYLIFCNLVISTQQSQGNELQQAGKDYADLLPGNWSALSAK